MQIEITIRSFAIINNTVFIVITNLEWLPSTKKEDDEDPTLEGNEGARNSSSNGLPPGNLHIRNGGLEVSMSLAKSTFLMDERTTCNVGFLYARLSRPAVSACSMKSCSCGDTGSPKEKRCHDGS